MPTETFCIFTTYFCDFYYISI